MQASPLTLSLWLTALSLAGCSALPSSWTALPPPIDAVAQEAPATEDSAWTQQVQALLPTDVLLLGEQHDALDHQRLQREAVTWMASRGQLAGVVMEMAERGTSTAGLPRDATEEQAQSALQWRDAAWPWKAYGPVVMAAVVQGIPVRGGNLPRVQMRQAMAHTDWDRHLPDAAWQRQHQALRDGHCGLLPEAQLAPMARIQIARDASLARTAQEAIQPGQTVLLIAGSGHVWRSLGAPTHWGKNIQSKVLVASVDKGQEAIKNEEDADAWYRTPSLPAKDHCAGLRAQWGAARPPRSAPANGSSD